MSSAPTPPATNSPSPRRLSGGTGLTKSGLGTLVLGVPGNSYGGPTTIDAGTLKTTVAGGDSLHVAAGHRQRRRARSWRPGPDRGRHHALRRLGRELRRGGCPDLGRKRRGRDLRGRRQRQLDLRRHLEPGQHRFVGRPATPSPSPADREAPTSTSWRTLPTARPAANRW